jgi:hypothetical protein
MNWSLALLSLAALVGCFFSGNRAADEAIRTYGHNVDSGAYIILFGVIFFLPASLLLTIAGTAFWRHWRGRLVLQVIAVAWLLLPVIGLIWR